MFLTFSSFKCQLAVIILAIFASVSAGYEMIDHPGFDEISAGLKEWESACPDRMDLIVAGKSVRGREVYLVKITDEKTPDTNKQVVLITTAHSASEIGPTTGTLHLAKWLISNDKAADKIRKGIITLIMPCNNPDIYGPARGQIGTVNGYNLYRAWSWDGPVDPCSNPEGAAIFKVAQQYKPDVSLSVHSQWRKGRTMWESTGFSWVGFESHSYQPLFLEQMRRAAEAEGFLIMRPGEYTGRIKVRKDPPEVAKSHYYRVHGRDYNMKGQTEPLFIYNFLYHRYHTLATMMEYAYTGSFVAQTRRMLEMGLERWEQGEFYPGYLVNQVGGWVSMSVCAYGQTAQQRRTSRVELWSRINQINSGVCYPEVDGQIMAYCATTVKSAEKWLEPEDWASVVEKLKSHPIIDANAIIDFNKSADYLKFPSIRYNLGYKAGKITDEPIVNGLSLRVFIPYADAELYDVRIDGKPVDKSEVYGYMVQRNPGTVVQFNIPPKSVGDLHIVSCKYKPSKIRRLGFSAEDWKLDN